MALAAPGLTWNRVMDDLEEMEMSKDQRFQRFQMAKKDSKTLGLVFRYSMEIWKKGLFKRSIDH